MAAGHACAPAPAPAYNPQHGHGDACSPLESRAPEPEGSPCAAHDDAATAGQAPRGHSVAGCPMSQQDGRPGIPEHPVAASEGGALRGSGDGCGAHFRPAGLGSKPRHVTAEVTDEFQVHFQEEETLRFPWADMLPFPSGHGYTDVSRRWSSWGTPSRGSSSLWPPPWLPATPPQPPRAGLGGPRRGA